MDGSCYNSYCITLCIFKYTHFNKKYFFSLLDAIMKIKTHFLVSAAVGFVLFPSLTTFAFCVAGGAFPDLVDGILSLGSRDLFWKVHRTVSHWLLWPVVFWLAAFTLTMSGWGLSSPQGMVNAFCLGLAIHLGLDILTPMGVPVAHPLGGRKSMRLIRSHSASESLVVLASVMVVAAFMYFRISHGIISF